MSKTKDGDHIPKDAIIREIAAHEGETVRLRGWIYSRTGKGKLEFLQLRDGTGIIQVVVNKKDVDETSWDACQLLTQESSLIVTGTVVVDKRSKLGFEIQAESVTLLQQAEGYPISPKEHSTPFLLDHRHLWLRSRKQHAILSIRSTLALAMRQFFTDEGFVNLDSPIFTPSACEGTSTLFSTEYFGDTAYLAQSGQFYMEAGAASFGKVYCFGPTFRAEKSKGRRHLTEFWMIEPEVAFADLDDIIDLAERFTVYTVGRVLEKHRDELENVLERDCTVLEKTCAGNFPRIAYNEVADWLDNFYRQQALDPAWEGKTTFAHGGDFGGDDETFFSKQYDRPVFVHRYPTAIKAFYMEPDPVDPTLSLSVDMLAPEGYGEIIGGGERASSLDYLLQQIERHNLPQEAFEWYLDLRRYGSFPHSGFGLGLERTVTWICGINHLREAIPFPRLLNRLSP
ncbi:MAG: asparagine--tRNA ligase [bacterium]